MNKKELKKKLSEAKQYRYYAQYAEALAILHQIVAEYPEVVYYYLLASTYYESGESEPTLQYTNAAIEVNPQYKEAYELKGLVYEKAEDYTQAEQMYLKALEIDPGFMNSRKQLIDIYYFKQERYEDVIEQCNQFPLKYKFETYKDKIPYYMQWFTPYNIRLHSSYILLNKYLEAIKVLNEYKEVLHFYYENENYTLADTDEILYKLYFLLKDGQGLSEIKDKYKNYYKVNDRYIQAIEKDADQGYILNTNSENYDIAPDGRVILRDE